MLAKALADAGVTEQSSPQATSGSSNPMLERALRANGIGGSLPPGTQAPSVPLLDKIQASGGINGYQPSQNNHPPMQGNLPAPGTDYPFDGPDAVGVKEKGDIGIAPMNPFGTDLQNSPESNYRGAPVKKGKDIPVLPAVSPSILNRPGVKTLVKAKVRNADVPQSAAEKKAQAAITALGSPLFGNEQRQTTPGISADQIQDQPNVTGGQLPAPPAPLPKHDPTDYQSNFGTKDPFGLYVPDDVQKARQADANANWGRLAAEGDKLLPRYSNILQSILRGTPLRVALEDQKKVEAQAPHDYGPVAGALDTVNSFLNPLVAIPSVMGIAANPAKAANDVIEMFKTVDDPNATPTERTKAFTGLVMLGHGALHGAIEKSGITHPIPDIPHDIFSGLRGYGSPDEVLPSHGFVPDGTVPWFGKPDMSPWPETKADLSTAKTGEPFSGTLYRHGSETGHPDTGTFYGTEYHPGATHRPVELKNPIVVPDRTTLAETIGSPETKSAFHQLTEYMKNPVDDSQFVHFDRLAAQDALSKGHDGIIYQEGDHTGGREVVDLRGKVALEPLGNTEPLPSGQKLEPSSPEFTTQVRALRERLDATPQNISREGLTVAKLPSEGLAMRIGGRDIAPLEHWYVVDADGKKMSGGFEKKGQATKAANDYKITNPEHAIIEKQLNDLIEKEIARRESAKVQPANGVVSDIRVADTARDSSRAETPVRSFPTLAEILAKDPSGWHHDYLKESHRRSVETALAEGKPVPADVLKDYPDLQAKAEATRTPEDATVIQSPEGQTAFTDLSTRSVKDPIVTEVAKELGVKPQDVIDSAKEFTKPRGLRVGDKVTHNGRSAEVSNIADVNGQMFVDLMHDDRSIERVPISELEAQNETTSQADNESQPLQLGTRENASQSNDTANPASSGVPEGDGKAPISDNSTKSATDLTKSEGVPNEEKANAQNDAVDEGTRPRRQENADETQGTAQGKEDAAQKEEVGQAAANAHMAEAVKRLNNDLPPDATPQKMQDWADTARKEGYDTNAVQIAKEVINSGKKLGPEKTIGLAAKSGELDDQFGDLTNQIAEAVKKGEPTGDLEVQRFNVKNDHDIIARALKLDGSDWGRQGVARKAIVKADMTVLGQIRNYEADTGKISTKVQEARFTELAKQHAQTVADLETWKERALKAESNPSSKPTEKIEAIRAERKGILDRLNKLTNRASVGIDPQIAIELGRLVGSYIKEGGVHLSDAVDNVRSQFPEFSAREIRDAFTGYRRESTKIGPPDPRMNEARRAGRLQSQIEDLENGEPIPKRLRGGVPKEIQDLLDRKARLERLSRIEAEKNRPKGGFERVAGGIRNNFLLNVPVFGKLISYDLAEQPIAVLRDAIAPAFNKLDVGHGKTLGDIDTTQSVRSLKATSRRLTSIPEGFSEAWNLFRHGTDVHADILGESHPHGDGFGGMVGRMHGATKQLVGTQEFRSSFERGVEAADKKNLNLADPDVVQSIGTQAAIDAQNVKLLGMNHMAELMSKHFPKSSAVDAIPAKQFVTRLMGFISEAAMPFRRVPLNLLKQTVDYTGVGVARGEFLRQVGKTGEKAITPEMAKEIRNAYVRGGIGAAVAAIGWLQPDILKGSGYLGDDWKKKGRISILGHTLPAVLSHHPIFEAINLWATLRNAYDKAHGDLSKAAQDAGAANAQTLGEQIPGYLTGKNVVDAVGGKLEPPQTYNKKTGMPNAKPKSEAGIATARIVAPMVVPGIVRSLAKARDSKTPLSTFLSGEGARGVKVRSAADVLKEQLPLLRNKLPTRYTPEQAKMLKLMGIRVP